MRFTEEEFEQLMRGRQAYAEKKNRNRTAVQATNLESNTPNEFTRAYEDEKAHKKYDLHIHHKRKRLADPDGISIKWSLDAIVTAGILPDDNAKVVGKITQSQEQTKENEETIIIITQEGT